MLSNIDVAHRPEAAALFRMALTEMTQSPLNVSLTLYKAFDSISEMSIVKALDFCRRTQARIPTVCAGLLEVQIQHRDDETGRGFIAFEDHHLTSPHRYNSSSVDELLFFERYASIAFIHRTARDFLRKNKQAELFLEENSQSCPSLRSTYVRALLARVLLLGFPESPTYRLDRFRKDFSDNVAQKFVPKVMRHVFREEYETGTAQSSLCEDVNHTLATVYQQSRAVYPLSHWSTRWSTVPQVRYEPLKTVQWSTTSSRSSSHASFHSTRSKFIPFPDEPIDFLGLAASWGLSVYVIKMFDSKQKHLDKTYANYLLCCAAWALKRRDWCLELLYDDWKSGVYRLMAGLLNRGGNPNLNLEHFSTTVWGLFLDTNLTNITIPTLEAMKAFLETGSDVNVKASHIMRIPLHQRRESLGPQGFSEFDGISKLCLREEMSPLFLVRHWMSTMPRFASEMKALESIIESKGGWDSHIFTRAILFPGTYPLQRLPQRQHDRILAALNRAHYGHGFRNGEYPEWNRCLEKICRQISQMYGDSDHGNSSDEDLASDTEIFYDSMDTQIVVDKQDEILARQFPRSERVRLDPARHVQYYIKE